jgi:hypothetical protein
MSSLIPYSRLSFCLQPNDCLSGTIMHQHLSSEQPQDAFTIQPSPGGFKPGRSYLRKDVRTSFKLCTHIFQKMYAHLLKHIRTSFQICTEIFFQIYGHLSQGIRSRSAAGGSGRCPSIVLPRALLLSASGSPTMASAACVSVLRLAQPEPNFAF